MTGKIQVAIFKRRNGRNKAIFRYQSGSKWSRYWHHITVSQARQALRDGKTELVLGHQVKVEEYKNGLHKC